MARLPLSPQAYKEYKDVRSSDTVFVVIPGHELDGDHVVERHGTHLIVEKQGPRPLPPAD
jgi:hypothetical protein